MPDEKKPDEKPEDTNAPTEIDETALYDAVSGAVDEVTITPEKEDDDNDDDEPSAEADGETPDDEIPEDGGDDGGTPADGDKKEPEDGDKEDSEADDDDDAAGDLEGGDVSEEKDGETGTKPKDGDDTTKEADPLNDPIPESTKKETAERIKSLIELVKDKSGSEDQRNEIVDQITATGTDADQYANTLGFLRLYNSTDTAERKQALEVARGLVKELALELGEGSTVTKLSDHEDLQAEVEAGTLTEARAVEIAATRERQTLQDSRAAAASEKSDTESQTQANVATGKAQLDTLETALRSGDTNYATIRPTFIKMLGPILKRTHPTEWGVAAREVYDQVKDLVPAAPKPKPKNQPLRPKQGAGGGTDKKTGADTALGAIDDALANM